VSLWPRVVGKVRRTIASALVSREGFADACMGALMKAQPRELARRIESALAEDSVRAELIRALLRDHGDRVLAALSDAQKMAALASLCDTRLVDAVAAINARPGGGFKYLGHAGDVRVIIGSGPQRMEGWLATDIQHLNVAEGSSWRRLFSPGSIDRILAEHVFEHLSWRELRDALGHVFVYLKRGGRLRLAVPDAFHPSRYYYNLVKPGGWETPSEHKLMLDCEMLPRVATDAGFEIRLLEYFDENGLFHGVEYDPADGEVQRCASRNVGLDTDDREVMAKFHASIPAHLRQQFLDRRMTYTSLIADLVKPE